MKPKSFNRDMRKELSCTLAAYGIMAAAADVATVSAWDYVTWWICSITADLSALLRLPDTAVPGPEPSAILNPPLTTIANAAADCRLGTLIAAVVAVTAGILALRFASWACAWARLHDGTFAGDRAPTRTHGDAWLESRPSRVARRCPPWDRKAAAEGSWRPAASAAGSRWSPPSTAS